MNGKQKTVIFLGIVAIILMGLFPPWTFSLHLDRTIERPWGYEFFLDPPKIMDPQTLRYLFELPKPISILDKLHLIEVRIDFKKLLFQWIFVILVVSGLVLILQDRKIKAWQNPDIRPG